MTARFRVFTTYVIKCDFCDVKFEESFSSAPGTEIRNPHPPAGWTSLEYYGYKNICPNHEISVLSKQGKKEPIP